MKYKNKYNYDMFFENAKYGTEMTYETLLLVQKDLKA